jgi:hypothetical protein
MNRGINGLAPSWQNSARLLFTNCHSKRNFARDDELGELF